MENSPKSPESDSKEQDYQYRRVALEANQLHGKELPPESIGHVLISGEAKEGEQSKETIDWQRVSSMSRSELLDISEEIIIDNTTLRHVYDTHLIGENGLRRLVYEQMRGGDLRQALHHEILEHETGFERDPQLRHQPLKPDWSQQISESPADVPSLADLLSKAGLVKLDPNRELIAPKVLPDHTLHRSGLQTHQRRLLDIALGSVILILLILVILLLVSRR